MNNSAAKVGEIYREAGTAFNKLSEMTLMLQPTDDSPPGAKWSDAEVEMLRGCINRFAVELNKISQHIKNRTMRHLRRHLQMDSGTIQDVSSSPQHLAQQPQPVEENMDSESQCPFNESFVNIFSQGMAENVREEYIDQFLRHFDPSVVNSMPPFDFMQEDSSPQQPASEFEDLQDSSYERTLQAVPSLISLLDADVNANNAIRNNPTESGMANIGTLHAELPNFGSNLGEATGANYQGVNYNSFVSRQAHFSLRQAQATWSYGSSPATNQTMGIPIQGENNHVLYPGSNGQSTSVQASAETASTERETVNESQYSTRETVSSTLTQNTLRPGFFNGQSTSVQASAETASTEGETVNESQYSTRETVSSTLTQNTLRPGFFNGQSTSVQASAETASTEGETVNESQYSTRETVSSTLTQNTLRPGFFNGQSTSVQASAETSSTEGETVNESQYSTRETVSSTLTQNTLRPGFFNGQSTSVQASAETASTEGETVNESQYSTRETVSSTLTQNTLRPGFFNGQSTSVQASAETASTEGETVNESQYSTRETVSSTLTQNTLRPGFFNNYSLPNNPFRSVQTPRHNLIENQNDTQQNNTETSRNIFYPGFFKNYSLFGNSLTSNINTTMPQERPPEILCPGPSSSLNTPSGSVQAPNDNLENGGSTNMSSSTNLFGNSLYSANPEPVTNSSTVRADTNEQALASSAHGTSGVMSRRRSLRRRVGPVTQESADPIISLPGGSTAEPNPGRVTRSCRRQTYEIEKPAQKRSRKRATTKKSTASSKPKAQKKKQSPA